MARNTKPRRPTPAEGNLFADEYTDAHEETAGNMTQYNFDNLFKRLSKSAFRSRFRLKESDIEYIDSKGIGTIRRHAEDFIRKRLAPEVIPNDGKQTPMRGHPVFIAQHATGCCCRGCFEKWHGIKKGHQLTAEEQDYAVSVIMEWIKRQTEAFTASYGHDAKTIR